MFSKKWGFVAGAALILAGCQTASDAANRVGDAVAGGLRSLGFESVSDQGCAFGGLAGGIAGGVIGNRIASDNRMLGTIAGGVVGATIGKLIGCSIGDTIEERRKSYASDADFYDNQIKLANDSANQLEVDNKDLQKQIASNRSIIKKLQAAGASAQEKIKLAQTARDQNLAALKSYEALAEQTSKEIEIQETVLAEIRGVKGQDARAKKLQREVDDLKKQNAALNKNIESLTAQNHQIGGFL
jgi:predicted RNase H-like nuclease (RuvC/YqgF family)